jgi:hypothetical protein
MPSNIPHTHNIRIRLVFRPSSAHRVRLSGARLPVCKNGDIVALYEGVDAVGNVFENALLLDVLAEYTVKYEDFPAAGSVYRQTRGGCDVT